MVPIWINEKFVSSHGPQIPPHAPFCLRFYFSPPPFFGCVLHFANSKWRRTTQRKKGGAFKGKKNVPLPLFPPPLRSCKLCKEEIRTWRTQQRARDTHFGPACAPSPPLLILFCATNWCSILFSCFVFYYTTQYYMAIAEREAMVRA